MNYGISNRTHQLFKHSHTAGPDKDFSEVMSPGLNSAKPNWKLKQVCSVIV